MFRYNDVVNRKIKKAYFKNDPARIKYFCDRKCWKHRIYIDLQWLSKNLGLLFNPQAKGVNQ